MVKNQNRFKLDLKPFSIGIGDRFGAEGKAQLLALVKAKEQYNVQLSPVWNKSYREHQICHTHPDDVLEEAKAAVHDLHWTDSYFIDADHINLHNVESFIEASNFFTIDVADFIGKPGDSGKIESFVQNYSPYFGNISIPGINHTLKLDEEEVRNIAQTYYAPIEEARQIYQFIKSKKGNRPFISEISMDETRQSQTPLELYLILALIAYEQIPIQTIAPKFTGNFFKGIDYQGNLNHFTHEFDEDLAIVKYCRENLPLDNNLKLSIHSGSDKFSIYGLIRDLLNKHHMGVHLKTAGTTWLEELIGLTKAGDDSLQLVKDIYRIAYNRMDELISPYQAVIQIDRTTLPLPEQFNLWAQEDIVNALTHIPSHPQYRSDIRQFFHISYKIAVEYGDRFFQALKNHRQIIGAEVTYNLFERHIKQLFI